ncbi:hypothetical protein HaLaN_20479 [Haematococcus lacustris]|uniref:Uncharacterized protein n=1 Tax=Haematococcus lacustris TaxID=44745 RepID=A0A699ZP76_HAELA|nr:hypothetical protein HaLaN_20479 [Haematococcus lacustris]
MGEGQGRGKGEGAGKGQGPGPGWYGIPGLVRQPLPHSPPLRIDASGRGSFNYMKPLAFSNLATDWWSQDPLPSYTMVCALLQ